MKARRISAGLSQEHLAQTLGVTYQQIQKYEKGASRIPTGRLRLAAALLGTSLLDLVGDPEPAAAPMGFAETGAPYDPGGAGEPGASELLGHYQAIKNKADRAMIVRMAKLLAKD